MIKLKTKKYQLNSETVRLIKEKVSEETCKTNLNPQLIFKQSFTGYTTKTFVGNWTQNGFWLSKFRLQLFQLRPDIIARFQFKQETNKVNLSIRYSIGFSSVVLAVVIIFILSPAFLVLGALAYFIGVSAMIGLYIKLAFDELDRLEKAITEKLL